MKMKHRILPFINLGLAVVMLFFALPKMGMSAEPLENAFWIVWISFAAIVMAANGNIILMSEEKRERLKAIKRQRALRFEKKLSSMRGTKTNVQEKQKAKGTAS